MNIEETKRRRAVLTNLEAAINCTRNYSNADGICNNISLELQEDLGIGQADNYKNLDIVIITYANGCTKVVNISADSELAMMSDILRALY